jgi:leucyl aminopeptidase
VPWAHLDIAGVAWDVRRPYLDRGGTGFGVRLLVAAVSALAGAPAPAPAGAPAR